MFIDNCSWLWHRSVGLFLGTGISYTHAATVYWWLWWRCYLWFFILPPLRTTVDMLLVFFNVACLGVKQYTISIVFALTWLDKKPAIFYTEGKHTHNYNTMAVWCVQVNLPRIHCNHIFFTNLEWIWSTDIQRRLIKSKTGIINRKWLTVSMF
jgi:hypothetical protein